jgi:uncharacterized protein
MLGIAQLDQVLAPVSAWACSRPDVLGLALVGSWACGRARQDSDVDLVLLVSEPQMFRRDERWMAEIRWFDRRVVGWHDADYGVAWSRHVRLQPACEIEFTFCDPSWAATDPVDPGTATVVSGGCRPLLDKAGLFEGLLAVTAP